MSLWSRPILNDPKWNNGNYYGKELPAEGITNTLELITMSAFWFDWTQNSFGRKLADPKKKPLDSLNNKYQVEKIIRMKAASNISRLDANSILYLNRAGQLFDIGLGYNSMDEAIKRIKAKVLMITSQTDILFPPQEIKKHAQKFNELGIPTTYFVLETNIGHVGGVYSINKASYLIRGFLED